MSLPDRLKYARQTLELSLADVAARAQISPSRLSTFETGKAEPALPQLRTLADIYHRPLSFFLEDAPAPHETLIWQPLPPCRVRLDTTDEILKLARQYRNLERWTDSITEPNLPFSPLAHELWTFPRAEQLAHYVRQYLGLGERPGQTLFRVLEEVCHVKVLHLSYKPAGGSACTVSERYGPLILINAHNLSTYRLVHLAEAFFHLLTWYSLRRSFGPPFVEVSSDEAQLATRFAHHLLMPPEPLGLALKTRIAELRTPIEEPPPLPPAEPARYCPPKFTYNLEGRISLEYDDLLAVARQFDVSVDTLLSHLVETNHIPRDLAVTTLKNLFPWIIPGERSRDTPPPKRPPRYQSLAELALYREDITPSRYADYLGTSKRHAYKKANAWRNC